MAVYGVQGDERERAALSVEPPSTPSAPVDETQTLAAAAASTPDFPNPLVAVASNDQLDAAARAEAEANKPAPVRVDMLAGYIRNCFQEAHRHKSREIIPRLVDCQRRREGRYDATKLAQIQAGGGSELYFNITATKCDDAAAWIGDVIAPVEDKPWTLEPTPVPDIPKSRVQDLLAAVVKEFQINGAEVTPKNVEQTFMDIRDKMKEQMLKEATKRVERMESLMEDQLSEADFDSVLTEFIDYLTTYPSAFVKGPILRMRKGEQWTPDDEYLIEDKEVIEFEAVSPFDMYPAPNARTIQESYLCEITTMDAVDLAAMRGQPGWNDEAINAALAEVGSTSSDVLGAFLFAEAERAQFENRDLMVNSGLAPSSLRGLEFWGPVQNKALTEWGMPVDGLPDDFRQINAIQFGRHVVYALENPDPMGERPYSVTSFKKVSNSIWGRALPEVMADCQDPACASMRNLVDNLSYCSGPMAAVDIDAIPEGFDPTLLVSRMVLQYNGSKAPGTRMPVLFFQPDSNADTLLKCAEYFTAQADERTQIPRYIHGNEDVSGAGQTASGMSMLMSAASKGIKRVMGNMDRDIVRTVIRRLYRWNMLHHDDNSLKGDAKVQPRGVLATLVREQTQQRRQEFLVATNNPTDLAIMGLEGRAAVMRKYVEMLDLPVNDVIPPVEVLRQQIQQQMAAQAEAAAMDAAGQSEPKAAA